MCQAGLIWTNIWPVIVFNLSCLNFDLSSHFLCELSPMTSPIMKTRQTAEAMQSFFLASSLSALSSYDEALLPWQWAPTGRLSSMAPDTPPFSKGKLGYSSFESVKELKIYKIYHIKYIRLGSLLVKYNRLQITDLQGKVTTARFHTAILGLLNSPMEIIKYILTLDLNLV